MATTSPITRLGGLARRLVQDGLLSEEEASTATADAASEKRPLVSHLVKEGRVKSHDVAVAASLEYGVPLFDLDAVDPSHMPSGLVEEKLVRKHHALPLIKRGNRLFLAVSDPTNHQGLDEIKFHTGLTTDAVLVEEDKLSADIDTAIEAQDTSMSDMLDADLENLDISSGEDEPSDRLVMRTMSDSSVMKYSPLKKAMTYSAQTEGAEPRGRPARALFAVAPRFAARSSAPPAGAAASRGP